MNLQLSYLLVLFVCVGITLSETENAAKLRDIATQSSNDHWLENEMDRLKGFLLKNYDKNARPSANPVISIRINPIFLSMDEHKRVFKACLWLDMRWNDSKLTWKRSDYANISTVNFDVDEVWNPEIIAFNSVDPSAETFTQTLMLVSNDGGILTVPPHKFYVFCDMDFTLWPYDKQVCSLKLGTMKSQDIRIESRNDVHVQEDYFVINEWQINRINTTSGTDPSTHFDYIEFVFELERKPSSFRTAVIVPIISIVCLILSAFWLPAQSGEKILLNGITALLILGFLLHFADLLPILGDKTPLIVLFLSSSLILTATSMIISVVVIYVADINHERSLPQFLRKILGTSFGKISTATASDGQKQNAGNNSAQLAHQPASATPTRKAIQNDWIMFATGIDRISFVIYCFVFAILAIRFFS